MERYNYDLKYSAILQALMEHGIRLDIPKTPADDFSESKVRVSFEQTGFEQTSFEVSNKCALVSYLQALAILTGSKLDTTFVNNMIIEIAQLRGTEKYNTLVPPEKLYNIETGTFNEPSYENMSFFSMLFHLEAQIAMDALFAHAEQHRIPFTVRNIEDGSDALCGVAPDDYQSGSLFTIETDGSHFRLIME